jgi:hypothetical protein
MKKVYLILIIIPLFSISYCQSWSYKAGENVFDGKYKIASVVGKGGKFPYNSPVFVINNFKNETINIYISDVGYAGCDNKVAIIKFAGDSSTYKFAIKTNSDKDTWFIDYLYYSTDEDYINWIKLLDNLKKYSRMYIRLSSDCGQTDLEFPLIGSTAAINFVASDYINKIKQEELSKTKKN